MNEELLVEGQRFEKIKAAFKKAVDGTKRIVKGASDHLDKIVILIILGLLATRNKLDIPKINFNNLSAAKNEIVKQIKGKVDVKLLTAPKVDIRKLGTALKKIKDTDQYGITKAGVDALLANSKSYEKAYDSLMSLLIDTQKKNKLTSKVGSGLVTKALNTFFKLAVDREFLAPGPGVGTGTLLERVMIHG